MFCKLNDLVHPDIVKLVLANDFAGASKRGERGHTSSMAQQHWFTMQKVYAAIGSLDLKLMEQALADDADLQRFSGPVTPLLLILGLIADKPRDRPKPCEARTKQLQMLELILNSQLKCLLNKPSRWATFHGHGITPLGLVAFCARVYFADAVLSQAVLNGDLEATEMLIKHGANINAICHLQSGFSPVFLASCADKRVECLKVQLAVPEK
jgi:hypothetical protein